MLVLRWDYQPVRAPAGVVCGRKGIGHDHLRAPAKLPSSSNDSAPCAPEGLIGSGSRKRGVSVVGNRR